MDEKGGDDDRFLIAVIVEALTPEEAMAIAERRAGVAYGESNVLGAHDARELA